MQAAINAAQTYLPSDLPNPPIYSKVNPADAPILTLALTSKTLPLSKVEDLADTALAQKISQVTGVGLVSISGGQKPAVRIQANPTALASYGLSMEDVRTALAAANVDQAKGTLNGPRQSFTIGANDQLLSGDQYRPIVIAYRNGSPVRVSDVATVTDGIENIMQAAWMNQDPAVIVNIQRQPGANIISVVDRIKKLLPQLQASLPAAVQRLDFDGPDGNHSGFGQRCSIRVDAHHCPGGDGDLPLSPQPFRHRDSERGRAALDRGDVRGDVPAGLQPQ